ncbi:PAS domain-containing protein [Curvivirga aplysinae]|uniref:PAS domain-containing protein n=1 Tax=Curvivirga aplysinae TaxID=2529852 RepID=UPI0012BBFE9B|nr:PAS domain-containing protein [Curvivirga aplysinae]MTI10308.1 PAS domain-containing protein [Curvivirga aplysinae]
MKITNLDSVLKYWKDKKGERLAPSRQDIDPVDFPRIWPNTIMYKVIYPKTPEEKIDFQVTRMGGNISSIWGYDQTGCYFNEIFVSPYKEKTRELFEIAIRTAQPSIVETDAGWMGKDHIKYKRLTLPLSDDGQTVNRLFLYLVFE